MEHRSELLVPEWVPDGAKRYLAHTETGHAIRDLARSASCHASTVLRQIRRMESRRDDPLVDAALVSLAREHFGAEGGKDSEGRTKTAKDRIIMSVSAFAPTKPPSNATLEREAARVLRRLCETGAVLAVAEDMEKSVVVRDDAAGSTRTAVVDSAIAQAMALKDWIACANPGRISRYRITPAGRAALSQLLAGQENRVRSARETGFAEAQAGFDMTGAEPEDVSGGRSRRQRYSVAESPLTALSRRRDKDGKTFLSEALVRAGERLREDFELAQMGPRVTQDWEHFLTSGCRSTERGEGSAGGRSGAARERVERALRELGPGLSDVALRCCCFLEGLEIAEKRMGWSARSGKIVLRIALQRLERHYNALSDADRMIG